MYVFGSKRLWDLVGVQKPGRRETQITTVDNKLSHGENISFNFSKNNEVYIMLKNFKQILRSLDYVNICATR